MQSINLVLQIQDKSGVTNPVELSNALFDLEVQTYIMWSILTQLHKIQPL